MTTISSLDQRHPVDAASTPLVLHLIPSAQHHQSRDAEQIQLATTMRSLVLDQKHPIALEITGTHHQRSLLLRARHSDDLNHVQTQLHARLPQASFVPLAGDDDPFHLGPGETVSVVELRAGQAAYLPLQDFERLDQGEDPLLGIFGALDALPPDLRAIAQIALVPAPSTWSQTYQRKALEHALEPERQEERQKQTGQRGAGGAPSFSLLLTGVLFLAGYFLIQQYPSLLPAWVSPTFQLLLQGHWQQAWSGPHRLEKEELLAMAALVLAMPLVLQRVWTSLFQERLYDMRSVAERTSRLAYQVRLRLYVIGPCAIKPPKRFLWQRLWVQWGKLGRGIGTWIVRMGRGGWRRASRMGRGAWTRAGKMVMLFRTGQWWRNPRHRMVTFRRKFHCGARSGWEHLCRMVSLLRTLQWWQQVPVVLKQRSVRLWKAIGRRIVFASTSIWERRWWVGSRASAGVGWIGKSVYRVIVAWTGVLMEHLVRQWRYLQATREQDARRTQILARLIAAYRQYHLASGNYFVPKRVRARRAHVLVDSGTWWKGLQRSRHLLDVEALGVLWHIPADGVLPELAHLSYRQSRSRLLPPSLQSAQREPPIGISEHAGHRVPFGLPADCLQSHLLIGGKSGEGKSTLMVHLARRSMMEHEGLVVIDPHGDLVEQILPLVPPERRDDVVLIDLSEERFACGLNPIDATVAHGRDKAISDLIKILSHIWASAWGSRMEIACEYALRTLYEANKILCEQGKSHHQYTVLDIMPILTDQSFCHALLESITDPFILRWWSTYFDPLSLQMQRDRIDPVLSKMAKFEGMIARHIVGQSLCTVDFPACLAQKKIVLVKLAKPLVGEDVARILGATLLGFLTIAFEEQGKDEEAQRPHVPILIDEFQTLEGVDWGALAELRKYGATFCLATQSLEYLREKQLLPVVLANVKQLAIFRMSADDAWMVHRELGVDPEDIVHLDTLTCYLKLVHQRQQQSTFSCSLHYPPPGEPEQVEPIRLESQRRYLRPVSEIDIEIFERLARQLGAAPSGDKKPPEGKPGEGQARQNGGNRGRKAQEKVVPSAQVGEITRMNWEETVGAPFERAPQEEQEEDPGDRAEEHNGADRL